jgi:DNA-binding NarL/FixJ family response regulator
MLSSIRTVFQGNAIIAPSATKRLIEKLIVPDAAVPDADGMNQGSAAGMTAPSLATNSATGNAENTSVAQAAKEQTSDSPELNSLTERELEVLIEIAHGLSNQEIADKLFVSLPTVKTHVAHLLAKINARDRVQAVVFAYETGLVS